MIENKAEIYVQSDEKTRIQTLHFPLHLTHIAIMHSMAGMAGLTLYGETESKFKKYY